MDAVERAVEIAFLRPLHIIRDHQIELAVAIVVHPGSAGGKLVRPPQSRGFGYVCKGTVAVVVKQVALADGSDEDVIVAVVVIVADGDPQTVHRHRQPGLVSNIAKCSVVIVVEELQSGRARLRVSRPVLTIHQEDVGPAVVVVVDERAPRTHGFGKVLLSKGAVVVREMDTGTSSDIAKPDGLSVRKTAQDQQIRDREKSALHFVPPAATPAELRPAGQPGAALPTQFLPGPLNGTDPCS